jgi:glycine oxidase
MIALRGRPVWRIDDAIAAFQEQLDTAGARGLYDGRGVLRPVKEERQIVFFKQSVNRYPEHGEWLSPAGSADRYPAVLAPMGWMFVNHGGAISTYEYGVKMVDAAISRGVEYRPGWRAIAWGEEGGDAYLDVTSTSDPAGRERLRCRRLILAVGRTVFSHPALQRLDLHAVKGQTARISWPETLSPESLPPVSGNGYLIPETGCLAIGSSFDHQFSDDAVSHTVSEALLEGVATMVPALREARILEEHVGIRVTVPKIRLPMAGRLPGHERVWVFTGFGSKGLLLAPLLARELIQYLQNPASIPPEIEVRIKN